MVFKTMVQYEVHSYNQPAKVWKYCGNIEREDEKIIIADMKKWSRIHNRRLRIAKFIDFNFDCIIYETPEIEKIDWKKDGF